MGTTSAVNDVYQLGHLACETDGSGTILASFSYNSAGVPTSVVVGSDPTNTASRYYYVYNGHGDTVALVDATGNRVASYAYDTWGAVTTNTEAFANGWHNPYLYDGKDGTRYDTETQLNWLSVRAYDPTLGRFISRDPLGRAPLMGWTDQPYAYAGNNPLTNVDPSGQRYATESGAQASASANYARAAARAYTSRGRPHGSCKGDPNISACYAFEAWERRSETARNDALWPLLWGGAGLVIVGAVAIAWADWEIFQTANEAKTKFEAIKDMIATFILTVLPMVALLAPSGSPVLTIVNGLAAVFHTAIGIIDGALALLDAAGWLVSSLISKALSLLGPLVGGAPGTLMTIAMRLVSKAALEFLHSAGHWAQAIGWGMLTGWAWQSHLSIETWCQTNPGHCGWQPADSY